MSSRRLRLSVLVVVAVVCLVPVVAAACDDGGQVTTGVVLDIRQAGPAVVTGFTLRADDGRVMEFQVGETSAADGTFPSIHIRDHMASAQRVAVRYVETESGLVAIRLADAP